MTKKNICDWLQSHFCTVITIITGKLVLTCWQTLETVWRDTVPYRPVG